jgi:exodeoxyribonuclease V alpha subunit
MVNNEIHRNLFDALPNGGAIRVFGDVNQLQPIESSKRLAAMNSPFMHLLKKFDGITLTTIHRQGTGSGIVTNGDLIKKGFSPRRLDDFTIAVTSRPTEVLTDFVQVNLYENDINFGDLNHQIITPQNTSWVGTRKLNQLLQNIFMPDAEHWVDVPRHKWVTEPVRMTVGSKVICTKNNYDLEMFNGETGLIVDINEAGELSIDFGDRIVLVPAQVAIQTREGKWMTIDARRDIDLAYAVTTHKCQGSEYDSIIYVLNKSTSFMQDRRNFYTAITRARSVAHVITDQRSLGSSVWKRGDSR